MFKYVLTLVTVLVLLVAFELALQYWNESMLGPYLLWRPAFFLGNDPVDLISSHQ